MAIVNFDPTNTFKIIETTHLASGKKSIKKHPNIDINFPLPQIPIKAIQDPLNPYYIMVIEGTFLSKNHAYIKISGAQTSLSAVQERTYLAGLSVLFGPAIISTKARETPLLESSPQGPLSRSSSLNKILEDPNESLPETPPETPSRSSMSNRSRLPSIPEDE